MNIKTITKKELETRQDRDNLDTALNEANDRLRKIKSLVDSLMLDYESQFNKLSIKNMNDLISSKELDLKDEENGTVAFKWLCDYRKIMTILEIINDYSFNNQEEDIYK